MKHGHSCHTSDELEIGEVILVAQAGVGIDLESVVVPADTQGEHRGRKSFPGYLVMLGAVSIVLSGFIPLCLFYHENLKRGK